MGVLAILRYPIKAMLGERVASAVITAGGVEGDREWVVVDRATGERIANKRGPTDPRLRATRAELLPGGGVRVTLPDGSSAAGADIEPALSDLLERRVALQRCGDRSNGAFGAPGGHQDFAPIHLLTTGTLAHLSARHPEIAWDVRRFRPNLVLDDGGAPGAFTEDGLVGRALAGPAGVRMTVGLPAPRCVVPTRAHEELPADARVLRTLARDHRIDLGAFGRQPCAGAYAEVDEAGAVAVGDVLAVGEAATAPRAALRAAVRLLEAQLRA
jgi:uncharacterized protein YcbX